MTSPRHFSHFIALGLFWGVSPSLYKHLSEIGMPVSHIIFVTGIGVGLALWAISFWRNGNWSIDPRLVRYGAICALLMNVPFGINLFLATHVPPTELAIIITTSPFFNYLFALWTKSEHTSPRRLAAIAAGFLSTVVLIVSREGMMEGKVSWWLISSLSVPILYCFYNHYAARGWPKGADTLQAGASESLWSGMMVLPLLLWLAPFGGAGTPPYLSYWILGATIMMWIVERISYFILISEKGAVYTVQATYVSTPAAVIIAAVFFGGVSDHWLWVSLAMLMVALWLNNTGRLTPVATQQSA